MKYDLRERYFRSDIPARADDIFIAFLYIIRIILIFATRFYTDYAFNTDQSPFHQIVLFSSCIGIIPF